MAAPEDAAPGREVAEAAPPGDADAVCRWLAVRGLAEGPVSAFLRNCVDWETLGVLTEGDLQHELEIEDEGARAEAWALVQRLRELGPAALAARPSGAAPHGEHSDAAALPQGSNSPAASAAGAASPTSSRTGSAPRSQAGGSPPAAAGRAEALPSGEGSAPPSPPRERSCAEAPAADGPSAQEQLRRCGVLEFGGRGLVRDTEHLARRRAEAAHVLGLSMARFTEWDRREAEALGEYHRAAREVQRAARGLLARNAARPLAERRRLLRLQRIAEEEAQERLRLGGLLEATRQKETTGRLDLSLDEAAERAAACELCLAAEGTAEEATLAALTARWRWRGLRELVPREAQSRLQLTHVEHRVWVLLRRAQSASARAAATAEHRRLYGPRSPQPAPAEAHDPPSTPVDPCPARPAPVPEPTASTICDEDASSLHSTAQGAGDPQGEHAVRYSLPPAGAPRRARSLPDLEAAVSARSPLLLRCATFAGQAGAAAAPPCGAPRAARPPDALGRHPRGAPPAGPAARHAAAAAAAAASAAAAALGAPPPSPPPPAPAPAPVSTVRRLHAALEREEELQAEADRRAAHPPPPAKLEAAAPCALNCYPGWMPAASKKAAHLRWCLTRQGLGAGHVRHAAGALRAAALGGAPVQQLILDDNPLCGDEGAAALAEALSRGACGRITGIAMRRCGVTDRGCRLLAAALRGTDSCTLLDLEGNSVSEQAAAHLERVLHFNRSMRVRGDCDPLGLRQPAAPAAAR